MSVSSLQLFRATSSLVFNKSLSNLAILLILRCSFKKQIFTFTGPNQKLSAKIHGGVYLTCPQSSCSSSAKATALNIYLSCNISGYGIMFPWLYTQFPLFSLPVRFIYIYNIYKNKYKYKKESITKVIIVILSFLYLYFAL